MDKFITEDGQRGRLVEVIARGEPALMLAHWTGIYFNGAETGFAIFREVVKRLHAHFDHLVWMKLSEVARYWAAKELTAISRSGDTLDFRAPFACPDFTVRLESPASRVRLGDADLREIPNARQLALLQRTRYHTDHFAAPFQRSVGDGAHEPDMRTAIDDANFVGCKQRADLARSANIMRFATACRGAIHGDAANDGGSCGRIGGHAATISRVRDADQRFQ